MTASFAKRTALAFAFACLWVTAAKAAPPSDVMRYRAQEGDTLIALSQRFLERPQEWPRLAQLNHISEPTRIPVGSIIQIPVAWLKATERAGTVIAAVGQSSLLTPGQGSRPAQAGDLLPAGTTVRTASNGFVTVRLADGSIIKVQADTEATLDTSKEFEQAGFFASVWNVVKGRVEALVAHLTGGEPRFQIKTPQAVLGVRGTEFRVEADAQQGITRDETLSGAVAAKVNGPETLVTAGFGTVASQSGGVGKPQPLLPPPPTASLPDLLERILVKFELPVVKDAVAYRGQIASDEAFQLVRGDATTQEPLLRFTDLPDGDYFLRVRAIAANGLGGTDAIHRFKLKARPEPPIPTAPAPDSKWRTKAVTLSWSQHPDAQAYKLQVMPKGHPEQLLIDRADLREAQLDVELPPGDYQWRIGTIAKGPDTGPWGNLQTFLVRPAPAAPPPPTTDDEHISLTLPSEPGQSFDVQLSSDLSYKHLLEELHSEKASVILKRPQEGGGFFIRYRAIDADGYIGPWSTSQSLLLPSCIRTGEGTCMQTGAGRFMESPL